jgi:hypothetical protein
MRQREDTDDSSVLFDEANFSFEQELSSDELSQLENALIALVPEAKGLLKLKLANEKQRRINEIMAKLDNRERLISKLRHALSDVALIQYKQPSTEFVYYRFQRQPGTEDG